MFHCEPSSAIIISVGNSVWFFTLSSDNSSSCGELYVDINKAHDILDIHYFYFITATKLILFLIIILIYSELCK